MFDKLKAKIRRRIWEAIAPPNDAQPGGSLQQKPPGEWWDRTTQPMPVGIDQFSGLPVYYEPPECPVCPKDPENGWKCYDCGDTTVHEDPTISGGLESITVGHTHIHPQFGRVERTLRIPARRKLCLRCFRIDWAKANPDKPCDL